MVADPAGRGEYERDAEDALRRRDYDAALTALVQGYGGSVYRYCRRHVRNDHDAEDLRQLVFLQAYEAMAEVEIGPHGLIAWLRSIARHRCLDAIRRGRLSPCVTDQELIEDAPDGSAGVDERLEQEGEQHAIEACVDRLDARSRALVLLRVDGAGYEEIAGLIGGSSGALRIRMQRAISDLRRWLGDRTRS